ncbi:hypothetical protein G8V07_14290 [Clostridium botulinum D/C]|uniref:hypothetical protein n=1 Tax=Clostridium botulinum TaxID=1491 RepID=UPI001E58F0C3|nr:hypothetical protein [Clostridium botulinum]MCD3319528.1 hypothetical protein [Clostridium botulinum D/C]MCD3324894.1 hypothetical protein [Clostridium botulinum D/C]MCD3327724.1 hypothetical protein [Clostridium botulinum D/C]
MPYRLLIGGWSIGMICYISLTKIGNKNNLKYADLTSRIKKAKRLDKNISKSLEDKNLF